MKNFLTIAIFAGYSIFSFVASVMLYRLTDEGTQKLDHWDIWLGAEELLRKILTGLFFNFVLVAHNFWDKLYYDNVKHVLVNQVKSEFSHVELILELE